MYEGIRCLDTIRGEVKGTDIEVYLAHWGGYNRLMLAHYEGCRL